MNKKLFACAVMIIFVITIITVVLYLIKSNEEERFLTNHKNSPVLYELKAYAFSPSEVGMKKYTIYFDGWIEYYNKDIFDKTEKKGFSKISKKELEELKKLATEVDENNYEVRQYPYLSNASTRYEKIYNKTWVVLYKNENGEEKVNKSETTEKILELVNNLYSKYCEK